MSHYLMNLRTPAGLQEGITPIEFASLEDAYMDVIMAIPGTAGHLLTRGWDPMQCSYIIATIDGEELMEIPFTELVTQPASPPPSQGREAAQRVMTNTPVPSLSAAIERSRQLQQISVQQCARAVLAVAESAATVIRCAESRGRYQEEQRLFR